MGHQSSFEDDLGHDRLGDWRWNITEGLGLGEDLDRIGAREPAQEVGIVRGHIHEQARTLGFIPPGSGLIHALGCFDRKCGDRAHHPKRPQLTRFDEPLGLLADGSESLRLDHTEVDSGRSAGLDHPVTLGDVYGHGFLHQHVLSRLGCLDGRLGVIPLGTGDDHRVYVAALEKRLDRGLRFHAVILSQSRGPGPPRHRGECASRDMLGQGLTVGKGHVSTSDHADPNFVHVILLLMVQTCGLSFLETLAEAL